ncbi:MAG: hypothetical protein Q8O90_00095 [Elusimicrobiota bacterium]|nr:hypothetical protein [Elusimicrobiota bacterium]
MINKLVAAFACLGFAAQAGAEINFDQGIDVKSVIEQAVNSDLKGPYPYYGPYRVRYSRECKSFSFGPSAFAQASERAYLNSTEYIEECLFVPNPPVTPPAPNPNNPPKSGQPKAYNQPGYPGAYPGNPNDFGPHGNYSYPGTQYGQQGTWYCHERVSQTFRATAQLNIAPRQLYPWERESFDICMEGNRVELDTRSSPYRYSEHREGMYDITFNLTPNYRTPTAPDSNGLYSTEFSYKEGKFTLRAGDKWAREYAGEKVMVKVELFKDGFLFFNSSKGEKEFTFDAAAGYDLVFAEGDMVQNKDFADDSSDMRGPKKYYVKWGFRRIGGVSNNEYVNKGSTDKIAI